MFIQIRLLAKSGMWHERVAGTRAKNVSSYKAALTFEECLTALQLSLTWKLWNLYYWVIADQHRPRSESYPIVLQHFTLPLPLNYSHNIQFSTRQCTPFAVFWQPIWFSHNKVMMPKIPLETKEPGMKITDSCVDPNTTHPVVPELVLSSQRIRCICVAG